LLPFVIRYRQVAASIRDAIGRGELSSGDPVTSAKTISQDQGVSMETAARLCGCCCPKVSFTGSPAGLPFYVK
jgi:hypothetical protein